MKALALVLCLSLGCASPAAQHGDPATHAFAFPPESNRLQPGHAPTPFTADQIAASCAPDAMRVYHQTNQTDTTINTMIFHENDGTHVTLEMVAQDESGNELARFTGPKVAWTELQGHASFDSAYTKITRKSVTVSAGTFDCWQYRIEMNGAPIRTLSFAINLPGPPILLTSESDGDKTVLMELLDYSPRSSS